MHAKERVDVLGPRANELLVNAQDPYHTNPAVGLDSLLQITQDV